MKLVLLSALANQGSQEIRGAKSQRNEVERAKGERPATARWRRSHVEETPSISLKKSTFLVNPLKRHREYWMAHPQAQEESVAKQLCRPNRVMWRFVLPASEVIEEKGKKAPNESPTQRSKKEPVSLMDPLIIIP
ncbi:unnamed protein product, partial [Linum tenue]